MILQTRNVYERESKNLKEKDYLEELSMEGEINTTVRLKEAGCSNVE